MDLNRRSFLKGAALTGAAAAALALPGCGQANSAPSSNSSGSTAAPAEVGQHTWNIKPDSITDIAETKDYDIVIVGAGIAGLSAAEAAAARGVKVAVLEKTGEWQVRGVDVGHLGSKWQKENGVNIDQETACKLLYLWSQQTTNYNLIKTWAYRSGPVFDRLEELAHKKDMKMVSALSGTAKYGWDELPERWRVYPDAVSFVRGVEGEEMDLNVNRNLGVILSEEAEANGCEFFYNTPAEQLVGDAAGGITGVIAKDKDGKYIQFNAAKGVILATGDVCGNQEMIDAFAPICNNADDNIYAPMGANSGDGINMGAWAGAALSKSPAAPMVHQFTLDTYKYSLTSFIMTWLAVNKNGERYGAELPFEPYLTNARMNTLGNASWSIFDSDYAMYVEKQWPTKYEQWLTGAEEQLEEMQKNDLLFKADTLEDLAKQIGVPVENFLATVEEFNKRFEAGVDTQFDVPAQFLTQIKTGPFYATPMVVSVLTIPFGLHVNDDSQVCTQEDEPIEGLYAIGNVQGDFFGLAYPVHCPGISHGRSVTFGQLVGDALAQDKKITETA